MAKEIAPGVGTRSASQSVVGVRGEHAPLPSRERLCRVGVADRLDSVDGALPENGLDAERAARREASAAARHVERSQLCPPRANGSAELERRRTLARDHVRMIERRHERSTSIGRDLRRDRLAVVPLAIVEHDLGAVRARVFYLSLWRIELLDVLRRYDE
jgi:hypothetical protein